MLSAETEIASTNDEVELANDPDRRNTQQRPFFFTYTRTS